MGLARGQEHDGQRRLPHRKDRHALASDGVEHRDETVGPGLHRGTIVDRHSIGAAHAVVVGHDLAAERRQALQVAGDGGLVPQQVDWKRRGGDEEEIGPAVTDDLVREVGVAVPRVARLGRGRHATKHATFTRRGSCKRPALL